MSKLKKPAIILGMLAVVLIFSVPAFAADWFSINPIMTDEQFFGSYGENPVEGKIDYQYSEDLKPVEDCAKAGDYDGAKEAFLKYYRERKNVSTSSLTRDPIVANFSCHNIFACNGEKCYDTFTAVKGEDWSASAVDITDVAKGKNKIGVYFMAQSKLKEDISICAQKGPYEPVLSVSVNGQLKKYRPYESTVINPVKTQKNTDILHIRESGMPWDNNSKRGFLRFDLRDIAPADEIEYAVLTIYSKSNYESEVLVFRDMGPVRELSWKTVADVFSWEGATGTQLVWNDPKGAEAEFKMLWTRLTFLPAMTAEYLHTGDEYYAYHAIRIILDFYNDRGKWKSSYPTGKLQGGWPRSLDSSIRQRQVSMCLPYLAQSEHMKPEYFAEIVMQLWQTSNFFYKDPTAFHWGVNWSVSEASALTSPLIAIPELKDIRLWSDYARKINAKLFKTLINPDGSYPEATSMYTQTSIGWFIDAREIFPDSSFLGKEFDEGLDKLSEYYINVCFPNGGDIRYGDSDSSTYPGLKKNRFNDFSRLSRVQKVTGNKKLLYFFTNGEEGEPFSYTTKYYDVKQTMMMRSGWMEDDLYLMINNDSGGAHAHPDDLAVIAAAYGKELLSDQGRYTYRRGDEINKEVRQSTYAHNTVTVDNKAQYYYPTVGASHGTASHITTSDEFDFYQARTNTGYKDVKHTRSVAFVRPNYWIVSDYLVPTNPDTVHSYEQTWHSTSNMKSLNDRLGSITSYDDNQQMQVVQNPDESIRFELKDGHFAPHYNNTTMYKYSSFTKEAKGNTTFDTVLYPNKNTDDTMIYTRKIETGDSMSNSMKIEFADSENISYDYYFISHRDSDYGETAFDKYSCNAKCVVAENGTTNQTKTVSMVDGLFVKEQGCDLIKSENRIKNITVEWSKFGIDVCVPTRDVDPVSKGETGEAEDIVSVHFTGDPRWVRVNGENVEYKKVGDYLEIAIKRPAFGRE